MARIRVVTLNMEQDHKRWEARRELIAEQLVALKPDVLALNEVCVPLQTARWLQKVAKERMGIEYALVQQTKAERPRGDRRRSPAHALPAGGDRKSRLPGARHGGAGRPHRRRRRARRRLCHAPLHVERRGFAAALPGAAVARVDRQPQAMSRRASCAATSTPRWTSLRRPSWRRAFGPRRLRRPHSRRSPTATARSRIPTGRAWTDASTTSGSRKT